MMPLISHYLDYLIWIVMLAIVAFCVWYDSRKAYNKFSTIMVALIISMLFSAFNLVPKYSPAYVTVIDYCLPLAIPLLLFKMNLRKVLSESRSMLFAFLWAVLGTIFGVLVSALVLPLGELSSKLAGIISATYIGGSMNMMATAEMIAIPPDILAISIAVDNMVGVIYIGLVSMMPSMFLLRKLIPSQIINQANENRLEEFDLNVKIESVGIAHLTYSLGVAALISSLGYFMAKYLQMENYRLLLITLITVLVVNLFPNYMQKLKGDYKLGMIFLYLFFVTIGLATDFTALLDNSREIVAFCLLTVSVHLMTVLVAAKFFKLDLAEVIIASNACIAGSATASALAANMRWKNLITPAVLLGTLGYVIANFVGIILFELL